MEELNYELAIFVKKQKVLEEIDAILNKEIDKELYEKRVKKIIDFRKKLRAFGFDPQRYVLWNVAYKKVSTDYSSEQTENSSEFDTPGHDIENFIRNIDN